LDNRSRRLLLVVIALAAATARGEATMEGPMLDPWVPPALRKQQRDVEPPAEGAALRAQVEAKLKSSFDAAARPHGGTLTREQARASGFGFIANHFDAIDRRAAGQVTFEDYRDFLRSRSR
jgi:hypothetical protein